MLLMHPKEVKKNRTGTGWITRMTLKDCEIIEGLDFAQNPRLQRLLKDTQYYPVLLYPGEDAWNAQKPGFAEEVNGRTILAIIIDSTWFCSRKMIEHNPELLKLPKLSFCGDYRSIFTFKREPRPEYISTIETCYYLTKELSSVGLANPNCGEMLVLGDAEILFVDVGGRLVVDFRHHMVAVHLGDDKLAPQGLPSEIQARVDV